MAYFRLINCGFTGQSFSLFGDGEILRDFTFIDDTINALKLLMVELTDHEFGFSDVVNVGGGKPTSLRYMISEVERIMQKKIDLQTGPHHKGDVMRTMADSSYLQSLVGVVPSTPITLGLEKTIEWSRSKEIMSQLSGWASSVG
jgi:nucleoside-diphosphate-sugar epimerase